jgi:hypothetical protein
MSSMMDSVNANMSTIGIVLCVLIAIALFITNITILAQNGVMADSYSDLKGQISKIWSLGGVGILFSFIAIWIYCNNPPQSSATFISLIMSSLAIFISYCAMATAVIVKR